tara:strand:- start:368 stop:643 length:276 start_codon:yes stop_codon:yes gene_type:complete
MATKKTAEKKATEKAAPAKKEPAKKSPGRPPKLAEITELDLGPVISKLVRQTSARSGNPTGDVVRALVRLGAEKLRGSGSMGVDMLLKKHY